MTRPITDKRTDQFLRCIFGVGGAVVGRVVAVVEGEVFDAVPAVPKLRGTFNLHTARNVKTLSSSSSLARVQCKDIIVFLRKGTVQ